MRVACLRPLKAGLAHGLSTMPKLRVGMPPTILAIIPQIAKMLLINLSYGLRSTHGPFLVCPDRLLRLFYVRRRLTLRFGYG